VEAAAVWTAFFVIVSLPGYRLGFVTSVGQELIEDIVCGRHTERTSVWRIIKPVVVYTMSGITIA
jgi:hypothetical protein